MECAPKRRPVAGDDRIDDEQIRLALKREPDLGVDAACHWGKSQRGAENDDEYNEYGMDELLDFGIDSLCPCSGPCECMIEHDGTCENGYASIFLVMGLI